MDSPVLRKLNVNAKTVKSNTIGELADFMIKHSNSVVITGAGISSGSGIPTYRDDSGTWKSNRPIQHAEFMRTHSKEGSKTTIWVIAEATNKFLPEHEHEFVPCGDKSIVDLVVVQPEDLASPTGELCYERRGKPKPSDYIWYTRQYNSVGGNQENMHKVPVHVPL